MLSLPEGTMLVEIRRRMLGHLGPEHLLLLGTDSGGTTGMRLGIEVAVLLPLRHVPLDGGDANAEGAGNRVFVLVTFDCGYDLGPQVGGIGTHILIMHPVQDLRQVL
jgi:hypothetical protein